MPRKKYFSYIRVSTQRQGQHGTSLTEQQAAIERFATNWNLSITRRFEERETAAKQGRPVFLDMLKQLKKGGAQGVIIHKIDRSARNLKDWADLGSLIDAGLEVHFASESLNLSSRGGRLSADIQAVVASDYIRNLREETKKGIYGRLKQGLYPFRAMIGYRDRGPGKPKEIDSIRGPLIRKAFELYSTGDWSLELLTDKLYELGLRNKKHRKVTSTGLATILHNTFYMGVITIKKTDEIFPGIHEPIISKNLFDRVQRIFEGKAFKTEKRHFFMFRRLVRCKVCTHLMTPETQKGFTYYRCHTRNCTRGCLKEEEISKALLELLRKMQFSDIEYKLLRSLVKVESNSIEKDQDATRTEIERKQGQIRDRHSRLADAYVDGVFDEATYMQKKNELVLEEHELKERLRGLQLSAAEYGSRLDEFFELANSAYLNYLSAIPEEKRDLAKIIISNITSDGKNVLIEPKIPFRLLADRNSDLNGCPYRGGFRTDLEWFNKIRKILIDQWKSEYAIGSERVNKSGYPGYKLSKYFDYPKKDSSLKSE